MSSSPIRLRPRGGSVMQTWLHAALTHIVRSVSNKLISLHLQEIGVTQDARNELEYLKTTLSGIEALLSAAEMRKERDISVIDWLMDLKRAVNDAENILDELVVDPKVDHEVGNFLSLSNIPLAFSYLMDKRIENIARSLDMIAAKIPKLDFGNVGIVEDVGRDEAYDSSSFPIGEKIFGREKDKERLVLLLIMGSSNQEDNRVPVIPIVGMPGIGKTTLAHLLYNDHRIQTHFHLKIWLPVSDDFNVNTIIVKVIESATGSKRSIFLGMNPDHICHKALIGRRFLLVLDHVCHENLEEWNRLRNLLQYGAKGSKILVTTRSERFVSIMGTIPAYYLPRLSEYDCWSLFKKWAFRQGEEPHPSKVVIAKEIVKRCGGVPLAAKTLGNLLCSKTEVQWLSLLESESWEYAQEKIGILPALRLSYDHLPSNLKLCFNFCSLFPKDYEINKENLIQLWVAEGFILPKQGRRLEDIGNEHFDQLASLFFFEGAKKDEYDNITTCKMNHLVYDLVQSIAGIDYSIVHIGRRNFSEVEDVSESIRHISFVPLSSPLQVPKVSLLKARNVRTILLPLGVWPRSISAADNILSHFRYLRVLDLNTSLIEKLPSSIGELKNLRYLDLSWNNLKRLPNSISKLCKLQTLKLLYCYSLEELPRDIGKMFSLRHIEISSRVDFTHMPCGLGNLISLQTLSAFVVGKDIGCKLSELHRIYLRGNLSILYLENMRNAADAKEANLMNMWNLRSLELVWNKEDDDDGGNNISRDCIPEDVLEGLQPHPNLKGLHIDGYGGVRFSHWMMDSSFLRNIVNISLNKCTRCKQLPPFGKLPHLKFLVLSRLDAVEDIGSDFFRGSVVGGGFPSLKQLLLRGMLNLKKWSRDDGTEKLLSFPRLSKLTLADCPKLTTIPLHPSLKELTLENCSEELFRSMITMSYTSMTVEDPERASSAVSSSSFNLANLKSLVIRRSKDPVSLPENGFQNLRSLEHLEIIECSQLNCLPKGIVYLASLQSLRVEQCDSFTNLPEGIQQLASLRELYLSCCPKLQSLPKGIQHLTSLKKMEISKCPELLRREDWPKIAHVQEIIIDDRRVHTIRG